MKISELAVVLTATRERIDADPDLVAKLLRLKNEDLRETVIGSIQAPTSSSHED